jgi:hypothetical protein
MKDGGVGKGTAGRTALVDMPFRRCSTGTLNGLRCIANRQKKKQEFTTIPEAKCWEYSYVVRSTADVYFQIVWYTDYA